jgi:tripartite-type tricarboxylate transporter receptor subunit TctC
MFQNVVSVAATISAGTRTALAIAAVGALSALSASSAFAAWPERTVKLIVPYAPGGTTDIAARLVAKKLSDTYKQQFIVENKPGGNTQLGTEFVAKAAADGYTFLVTAAPFAINSSLYPKLGYDPLKDFEPVSLMVQTSLFLVVSPGAPERSVKELIDSAKKKPLNFASAGNGSISHMSLELFGAMTGGDIQHIPYKGSGQAIPDLLGGQVSYMFDNPSSTVGHIKSGKLIAVAYTGAKRSAALPNVPTVSETIPGFETVNWFGMFAPAKTPAAILDQMNAEVTKALKSADVTEQFNKDGVDVAPSSRADLTKFIRSEMDKWGKIVKSRNIKPD